VGAEPEVSIRDKLEALLRGERVEIDGATIAAKTFLSDLYRRRDFRPLWSAAATVELLESVRAIEEEASTPPTTTSHTSKPCSPKRSLIRKYGIRRYGV
jgi:hypothetical protein